MGKAGKGFKKPAVKKSAFTKKDIIYTSLIVAAVVVFVVIIAILIKNDDFIRTKNGRLQMDDNALIAEFAKKNGTKYYQIGEVGEIEGFTLGSESAGNSLKTFYPEDATSNVAIVYVGSTVSNHAEMAAYLSAYTAASFGSEIATPEAIELCGKEAYYVHCLTAPIEIEEEAAEETEEVATETEEVAEETEEIAEETEEVADTEENIYANDPACMIYATIKYDDERCVYIQTNTVEEITAEEGKALVETIAEAITLTDR